MRVVRYTREAMKEIMEGADPAAVFKDACYDAAVRPYNWIDVAAGCLDTLLESGAVARSPEDGAVVKQVLVDSRAVAEHGYTGRTLSEVSHDAWQRSVSLPDPDTEERIRAAGLNVSEWDYALTISMAPETGDHDALLPERTRRAVSEYFEGIAGPGFTVHVGKYIVDACTYIKNRDRFEEMARESLSAGREIGYSAYDVLKVRDGQPMRLCVPVTVRETHEPSDIPMDGLLRYMRPGEGGGPDTEHLGRVLWVVNPGLGPDRLTRMPDFCSSEAGMLLRESFEPLAAGETPWHFSLLPAAYEERLGRTAAQQAVKPRCRARRRR